MMETTNRAALNFLIADDDPDDQNAIQKVIWELNRDHKITAVYNGTQVLDFLFRRGTYKDCSEPIPDCVLLDLNMPLMGGKEVLKKLRRHGEFDHLNIYILSTSNSETEKESLLEAGANGFYTKGAETDSLKEIVSDILIHI
jgi:CheY-like chemotaxis protein